jgi:hypothetical protein
MASMMVPLRRSAKKRSGESGQAAVEAALTLPLTIFLILGTLQLFLMLQGRIMAEYAAFRATRAGSLDHGSCEPMHHAAILALLPRFQSYIGGPGGRPAQKLAAAFALRKNNRYFMPQDRHTGNIVWLLRDQPLRSAVPAEEDQLFDQHRLMRLETRLVYFFPLKIPGINRIMMRMIMARYGVLPYSGINPLMVSHTTTYRNGSISLEGAILNEMRSRYMRGEYVVPIHASGSMRMMTPARSTNFKQQHCSGNL